ncbi:helicase-exonuclease AddAB subunit AddA [Alicyclobacillus fructus]|uniref:helicase-exonuclease AddAB subunit AddA n=1 Tax=Alicyclobacillus fructus TaxID=2816082 RepID=UPI001A8D338F|nr:helicase-exonuclease AddAB subunit AddA [Alicyclobacillus fructus]
MSMNWSDEQRLAIFERGVNLVVSAGAGSGKTAVLAERIASLAEEDPKLRMDQLLVMTFTEAAAAEMRARIGRRLRERAAEWARSGRADQARRFRRLADRVHDAQISTIHSFCLSLLGDHAVDAKLAPGFRVLSSEEDAILMQEAAEAVLDEWTRDPVRRRQLGDALMGLRLYRHRQAVDAVLELCKMALSQVHPDEWLQVIAQRYDADRLWESPFADAFARYASAQVSRALSCMKNGLAELERLVAPEKVTAAVRSICSKLEEALSLLSTNDGPLDPDALAALIHWSSPRLSDDYQPFKVWRDEATKAVQVLRKVLKRGREALEADVRAMRPHIEVLTGVARETLVRAKSRRLEEHRLSFSDLEHMAYALLTEQEGVREALHARYRYVFVDEYQDTSPIQDAIVDAVAPPGGLFLVGDVKQSIYGFRMAEPGLFLARYRKYAANEGGKAIDLAANYRSRSGIVHFVNYLFGQLFHADVAGFDYADGHEMKPGADYPDDEGAPYPVRIKLFLSGATDEGGEAQSEDGEERADSTRDEEDEQVARQKLEIEAMWVADEIARAIERGDVVYDRAAKAYRPLAYQDVAILLRAGGEQLNTVVQVLASKGIPAVARSSSGFFRAMEVRWAIQLLAALDNPLDSLALATALKSPFVGLGDRDLAAARTIRPQGPLWHAVRDAAQQDEGLYAPLRHAVERLRQWRELARELPPAELLRRIVRDSEIDLYLRAMPRGSARAANLEQLIRLAQAHAPHAGDLYRFLTMVRRLEEADVDLGHAQGAGANSVAVMTIHGSKGLEFPHVYVLSLGREFPHNQSPIALHRRLGIGATRCDAQTGVHWRTVPSIAVDYANLEASRAEEARVLYVALTRAKERLVLVGHAGKVTDLARAADSHDEEGRLHPLAFFRGKTYASWILPAILRHPDGAALRELLGAVHLSAFDVPGVRFELDVDLNGRPQGQKSGEAPRPARSEAGLTSADALEQELRRLWEGPARGYRVVRVEPEERRARLALPSKLTATDIRRLFAERELRARGRHASAVLDDPAFVREGAASPRERGVAFHTFMQRAPLKDYTRREDVQRAAQVLVEQGLLDARMAAALHPDDVIAFFASALGQRVLAADEVYREQPFFYRVDVRSGDVEAPVVIQGVIDCLIRDSQGYAVIDYKTDQVTDEAELDRLVRAYEPQVATYAAAVRDAVGSPVEVYLYFVHARAYRATQAGPIEERMRGFALGSN